MSNKLTDEQIAELAPDWATHYYTMLDNNLVGARSCICFFNDEKSVLMGVDGSEILKVGVNPDGVSEGDKPIPRKKFDISEYEFSDSIAEFEVEVCDTLVLKSHGSWFSFDKDDAVAIAKHFKLTEDDLK